MGDPYLLWFSGLDIYLGRETPGYPRTIEIVGIKPQAGSSNCFFRQAAFSIKPVTACFAPRRPQSRNGPLQEFFRRCLPYQRWCGAYPW
jgi:hypothetical protein